MRIAIIGAGVSGLGAAYALDADHDVTVYEQDHRAGGHANTIDIDYDGTAMSVDTGFIVFNTLNYPNLVALLQHLNVETFASDMSFAVSDPKGYEWCSNGLQGVFAWKRNLCSPQFLCMLSDIVRFSAQARADLNDEAINFCTLEDYVRRVGLGQGFLRNYLLPMGAAIWSTPERDMLRYPAASFLRFFNNHRLLHASRPQWRTISGGSRTYVAALAKALRRSVRLSTPVKSVRRTEQGVAVRCENGETHIYDHVICATHSSDALALLENPTAKERDALAAIRYAPNTAYLHRDPRLMPKRRAAWASWNYLRGAGGDRVCVTYWMNKLQGLDAARPVFVTLNPEEPPAEHLTFTRCEYDHPQFDVAALKAQGELEALQGLDRISFAGAWLGNGFHEDGLSSGLRAAAALGARPPWIAHHADRRAHDLVEAA